MSYNDKTLTCRDCGTQFAFTAGEQEFYAGRGLTNEPGRCPECRAARKSSQGGRGGYSSGGGGGYDRERAPREMHTVTCASCGIETQVPFLPRTDKPVYCSDCYSRVKGQSSGGRSSRY